MFWCCFVAERFANHWIYWCNISYQLLNFLHSNNHDDSDDDESVCMNSNGEWKVQHASVVTRIYGARSSHSYCHCWTGWTASCRNCSHQRGQLWHSLESKLRLQSSIFSWALDLALRLKGLGQSLIRLFQQQVLFQVNSPVTIHQYVKQC